MIVLIPSYQPDARLVDLVRDLVAVDGLGVIVVDDGSGPAFRDWFAMAADAGADVLAHEVNRGKGAALRTGFAHVRAARVGEPVVCADSDGQHTLLDILRVAAAIDGSADMVLGVRRFTGRVPLRSRFGNAATATVFRLVTGTRIGDTQTGLRGYPARVLEWLDHIPGDRFEYELNALLRATREGLRIRQVEIATVYLADNESSHFRPVRDSLRVLRPLLAFAGSSLSAFALDAAVLVALYPLTGLAASVVAARLVSASVNFAVNRRLVFAARGVPLWPAVRRYALLALAVLAANLVFMGVLTPALGVLAAKLVTEAALFLAGYVVQSRLVFSRAISVPTPGTASTTSTSAPGVAPASAR